MPADPSAPRPSRWLAFATQAQHSESFWQHLSTLRGQGMQAALYTAPSGDPPPWSALISGSWSGLLLSPMDPMARQWHKQAEQLDIAVRWLPPASQVAGGS